MQVKELMTEDPACCISETSLQEVGKMMVDHDCGELIWSAAARRRFGPRRLDAALVRGGLTPLLAGTNRRAAGPIGRSFLKLCSTYTRPVLAHLCGCESIGVKPPDTKAASSRRTPKLYPLL
jgi:CBS domain-containing protein